jgi:hypothetical protein
MGNKWCVLACVAISVVVAQTGICASVTSDELAQYPAEAVEAVEPSAVSSSTFLPGDANEDGWVTDADYTIWADNYGATGATWQMGDWNGDGEVTDADYTIWADNYGAGYNAQPNAPEPLTAIAVLTSGGLVAGYLRRRLA